MCVSVCLSTVDIFVCKVINQPSTLPVSVNGWPNLSICVQEHRAGKLPRHHVRTLRESKARELFRHHSEVEPSGALLEVEAQILRRCAGLPLALKLAGSRLSKIQDLDVWQVSTRFIRCNCFGATRCSKRS
jgi:hypothetical protein